jgi:hypothetical protein
MAIEPGEVGPIADARAHATDTGSSSEYVKPLPLSFAIDYVIVSDYIFRGINFSEYSGEGREKLNHQLGVNVEYDTPFGDVIGVTVWFEWYEGQQDLTPTSDSHVQEVDYAVYYRREFECIATTVETGWIAYHFPRLSGDAAFTHEWYISLAFDDSALFGTDGPVLNPTVTMYWDMDDFKGRWFEIGISHDFVLADCQGLQGVPVIRYLTLTPSLTFGIDNRWLARATGTGCDGTRLANIVYGLAASYDLSGCLDIPPQYGSIALTGFLNFSQAVATAYIQDEFYGGFGVTYSW